MTMWLLLFLPGILGLALIVDAVDDDDDSSEFDAENLPPNTLHVPEGVTDFSGTNGDDLITAQSEGGFIRTQAGDDTVMGSAASDQISGRDGDDSVLAEAGDDTVWGDQGDDFADGGAGSDRLIGSSGADTLLGGDGNDHVSGGNGDDEVFGGAGDDLVTGSYGDDLIDLGDGDDNMLSYGYAGFGNDTVYGGAGNDLIIEGYGLDVVFGEDGDDTIRVHNESDQEDAGLRAPDTVNAGTGDDLILANAEDLLTGGTGADTFRILNEDAPFGPATITDFDPSEDVLQITDFTRINQIDADDFSLRFDVASGAVQLVRDTTVLASLEGLEAQDIDRIDFAVVRASEGF